MEIFRSRVRSNEIDALFDALLLLRERDECYRFFEDICTISELKSIAQRWDVARLLDQGETYQEIARTHSASSATISRVNRCLAYGAGGYRLVLDRMHEAEDE